MTNRQFYLVVGRTTPVLRARIVCATLWALLPSILAAFSGAFLGVLNAVSYSCFVSTLPPFFLQTPLMLMHSVA